jgi:hypothetical protein
MWIDGIQSLIREYNKVILWFIAGYAVIGVGLLVYLRFRFVGLAATDKATAPNASENIKPIDTK